MQISVSKDSVNFNPVEITTLQDFIKYATTQNYSPSTFKDNYRNKANFMQANSIGIDVDNDKAEKKTIEEAIEFFKDYKHIIMPSRSHRKEKNGVIADRYRIILFLDKEIQNSNDFTATWQTLSNAFPAIDQSCKDASRFFYPSPEVASINETGKLWPVTLYVAPETDELDRALMGEERGQLSKDTLNFLAYGVLEAKLDPARGNRRLFKATKDMQEQGFTIEEAKLRIQTMIDLTGNWGDTKLREKDIETIENAYKNEPMYAPREMPVARKSVFSFKTVGQLITEAKNINWLCEGLFTAGGFSMIVGPPKAGKSTLVRQFVKSVCEGKPFLNRGVERGRVLYLTFEEQPEVLKEQFDAVGIDESHDIIIHTGTVFDDRALPDLEAAIRDFEPSLVILDTIFDISQLESVNNYKEVKDALARIRAIARDTGAHILGVHHTNKGGMFMGSQAIFGAVDTMVTFVQQKDRRFIFSSGKHGTFFSDQEILFDNVTQSYTLGDKRERNGDDVL